MAQKSLLEKALEVKANKQRGSFSHEELDLVAAWLNGKVQLKQVMHAAGLGTGQAYVFLALGAKELFSRK